jgi:hypothetical protein
MARVTVLPDFLKYFQDDLSDKANEYYVTWKEKKLQQMSLIYLHLKIYIGSINDFGKQEKNKAKPDAQLTGASVSIARRNSWGTPGKRKTFSTETSGN